MRAMALALEPLPTTLDQHAVHFHAPCLIRPVMCRTGSRLPYARIEAETADKLRVAEAFSFS